MSITSDQSLEQKKQLVGGMEIDLLKGIGNTPLVEIQQIFSSERIRIFAKLEWFNPGGSVKDRPAYNMIIKGQKNGDLFAGKTIIDSTSGNTGIAYALIGAAKGFPVILAMPKKSRKKTSPKQQTNETHQ